MASLPLFGRKMHRWAAVAAALPLGVIIATGLLLQLKKYAVWIQPPTQRGSGHAPALGFERILEAARSVPEAQVEGWSDISRLDVRPDRGLIKVLAKNNWEVQLDAVDGRVLQSAYRRSDLIESLHDGSFFHEYAKLGLFFPAGILLLLLWVSGIYLWILPGWVRRRNARAYQGGRR